MEHGYHSQYILIDHQVSLWIQENAATPTAANRQHIIYMKSRHASCPVTTSLTMVSDDTDIDAGIRQSDEVTPQDSDICDHDSKTQKMMCGIWGRDDGVSSIPLGMYIFLIHLIQS